MNVNLPNRKPLVIDDRWIWIIVAIAFIVTFTMLFRGCDKVPSHKADVKEIKQDQKELKVSTILYEAKIDSLNKASVQKDKMIDSLKLAAAASGAIVKQKHVEIAQNKADYEKAKSDKDTAAEHRACEAAIKNAEIQGQKAIEMQGQYDSLQLAMNEKIRVKDSIIAAQQNFNSDMRGKLDNSYTKYAELNSDYVTLRRKHKVLEGSSKLGYVCAGIAGYVIKTLITK